MVDVNFYSIVFGTPVICAFGNLRTWSNRNPSVEILRLLLKHGGKGHAVRIEGRNYSERRQEEDGMTVVSPMSLALDFATRQPKHCNDTFRELLNSNQISSLIHATFWTQRPNTRPESHTSEIMIALFKDMLVHPSASSIDAVSRTKMLSFIARHSKEISDKELVARHTRKDLFGSQMATQDLAISAAQNGQTQLIKTLIENGTDSKILSECLSIAARLGTIDMVDILLDYCPWNIPYILSNIQTAWIDAAVYGKVESSQDFSKVWH